ncbi:MULTISPECIES: hypothetical protein [Vibrio]|uniref:Uncharacterized protein n=1 Tax=Vibrio tasmaniensis TaxID=212663 RepID=A0A2N7NCN4_9VIBR|nr:hypothetical protein [Vibrio tasmaniensis]PMO89866.1 hypothetical protein BCT01_00875 [Vibrio tasmaniensis]PMP09962.1 hypothetical protein BCS92_02215 [Vibrio tasmaniensis]TKG27971.1 hypothetical protein FC057_22550 [Vibrio tasmaniensis]TKG40544.1 hypothetical protein FC060_23835 [Vibrio tasmaniensis]TKG41664.1 hypothetical protein FC063_07320 [Vibrio tasmaniensis]
MGNRIKDVLNQKINDSQGEDYKVQVKTTSIKQSKQSSLSMSVFKSITPIVLKVMSKTTTTEEFAHELKDIITSIAANIEAQSKNLGRISGGLTEDETWIYRRIFAISAKEQGRQSKIQSQFILALLTNTESADKLINMTGIDKGKIQTLITQINSYNRYQERDNFFSTVNSSIISSANKVQNELSHIQFFSEKESALSLIHGAISVTAETLYRRQSDLPNSEQKQMLRKSCMNHATSIIVECVKQIAKSYDNNIRPTDFDEFDEILDKKVSFCTRAIDKTTSSLVNVIWGLENSHKASEILQASLTGTNVSTALNNIEILTELASVSSNENGSDNVQAKRYAALLNDLSFIVEYSIENTSFVTSIDREQAMAFAKHSYYNAFKNPLKYLHKSDADLSIKHLKMCNNIAIYLLSEQSEFNNVMNNNGLMPEDIQAFRRSKTIAFKASANNPLSARQFIVPSIAELTSVLFETQRFNWGINTAYLAPKLGSMLMDATNKLYLTNKESTTCSSTSMFRSSLESASYLLRSLWRTKSTETLESSNRSYAMGKISEKECHKVIEKFHIEYLNKVDELTYNSRLLKGCIDDIYNASDNFDYQATVSPN